MSVEHEVDVLADDVTSDYGWQCLSCGMERTAYLSEADAAGDADEHRITGQAEAS